MYLLDTDIIIWILRGNTVIAKQIDLFVKGEAVAASVISLAEVYQHIFLKEIPWTEELFSSYQLLPIDVAIARHGGLYWQEFFKKVHVSITDCLIAATARQYALILLTLNTRHFPMLDIHVHNPRGKSS